ncbi:hypothetical protein ElyMa_000882100 [Elysia marginata]|uniref:CCHC-type domain-containing protein n=1 Tax=Elysia marginata TaxID=1093978 RepID=A0AAV4H7H5_9GAST|nr:hypothetical protein ElyMa_000882100 [Elysia marginata]
MVDTFAKKSKFDALKTALTNHFTPKVNLVYECFKFRKMHQEQVESVDHFHVRLRRQAALCEFADLEREILSQMIEGVISSKLRKKALRDKVTLHQFLQEARNEELTNKQVGEIEREADQAAAISRKPRHFKIEGSQSQAEASFQPQHKGTYKQGTCRPFENKSKCRNCGGTFSHLSKRPFPAKRKICHSCGKANHFASVCRSSEKQERQKTAVKQIHHEDDESDFDSAGVFQINTKKSIPTVTADLCSNQVKFIVDTGASVNILTKLRMIRCTRNQF